MFVIHVHWCCTHIYALWNLPRPRRGVITANRSMRFASCELNILLVTKRHRVQTTDSRIFVHCWTRCWCAFNNSAFNNKPLSIYLFYFRFRRMLNRNALESFSLNENSLIVNNVIDTKSEHSAAQAQLFPSNSLLGLISFCAKGNFYPHSPKPLIRNRRSSPIRIAWQQEQPNANITNDVTCCQNPSNLFTCVWPIQGPTWPYGIFRFRTFQYDHKQRGSLTTILVHKNMRCCR